MTKVIHIDESKTISEAEWLEFIELMYSIIYDKPIKEEKNDDTDVFDYMHVFVGDE